MKRDTTIDILRGIAIFTMIAANTSAPVLAETPPMWFRWYGSLAAPMFIFLSGMMVSLTSQKANHTLNYFLVRGMIIMAIGAMIDLLVNTIYPFTTVDVLYLIGISLPISYFFLRTNFWFRWVIVILIFALTPILQNAIGYTDYPTEYSLSGEVNNIENQTNILAHWLVDGWFPIFPWAGFSLLGIVMGDLRKKYENFKKPTFILVGIGSLVLGGIIWWFYSGKMLTREGYIELFYPPTIGYILAVIGFIISLFVLVDYTSSLVLYQPFKILGEASLFMYLSHLAIIRYVISVLWSEQQLQAFGLIYAAFLLVMIGIAYGLKFVKRNWRKRPLFFKILLGG
jgi:uncharacterized membrane protein